MSARSSLFFLSAAIGAVLLAASGSQAAFAQGISEVAVSGRAPTQITISLVGKSTDAVRYEVRGAARTVCRNAIGNRELGFTDLGWCKQKSAARALRRYETMLARGRKVAGAPTTIVLSLR